MYKNKKGFTLVELMVVVAIMGILVAVAVPVYNNSTKKAKETTCAYNVRSLAGTLSRYSTLELINLSDLKDTDTQALTKTLIDEGYMNELPTCPGGGLYVLEDGYYKCTLHPISDEDLNKPVFDGGIGTIVNNVYDILLQEGGEYNYGKWKAVFEKYNIDTSKGGVNEWYRELVKVLNGGEFPTTQINGKTFYIMPMLNVVNGVINKDTAIYYANDTGDASNKWNTIYVYNKDDGNWYKNVGKGYNVAGKNWETVKADIEKNDGQWEKSDDIPYDPYKK